MKYVWCIALVVLISCQQGKNSFGLIETNSDSHSTKDNVKLAPKEYVQWNENPENGMIAEKTIGDFSFSCFYQTPEYLAIKELGDARYVKKEFNSKVKEYEGMQYFSFRIQFLAGQQELLKVGLKEETEYYARVEYFSFKMQKDFKMIDGEDTLDCRLFHFERDYGLSPRATFTMGFPESKNKNSSKSVLYEDKVFNVGNVYLNIKEKNLSNVPNISI